MLNWPIRWTVIKHGISFGGEITRAGVSSDVTRESDVDDYHQSTVVSNPFFASWQKCCESDHGLKETDEWLMDCARGLARKRDSHSHRVTCTCDDDDNAALFRNRTQLIAPEQAAPFSLQRCAMTSSFHIFSNSKPKRRLWWRSCGFSGA